MNLAIHTRTTKPLDFRACLEVYAEAGIRGVGVWRDAIEDLGASEARRLLDDGGFGVPSLVRAGFFTTDTDDAIDDARHAIDDAHTLGAEMIVIVCGATPGVPMRDQHRTVADALASLCDQASQADVRLAIEPLHPMYAADRSCVCTMRAAREILESIDHPAIGIAVDAFHVWWDPDLAEEIERSRKTICALHICDWLPDMNHMLEDRGLMGEGCIDLVDLVRRTRGMHVWTEVEIFSRRHWARDQREFIRDIVDAAARLDASA